MPDAAIATEQRGVVTAGSTGDHDPVGRWQRVASAVFGGAAAALVPWIVVLALTQPRTGVAVRLTWIHVGLLAAVLVGTAWCAKRPAANPVAGSVTATLALLAAWFFGLTQAGAVAPPVVAGALFVLVVTAVLTARTVSPPMAQRSVLRGCLIVLVVLQAVLVIRAATRTPPRAVVDHLKAAWVGLDVAEAVALGLLARAVRTGAKSAVSVGSVTAALLTVDAFINITAVNGIAQLEAVGMAVVELSLATSALLVARRTSRPAWL